MKKRKILIVNNGLAGGGIERSSVSLANYFVELEYFVNVVAFYKSEHFFVLDNRIGFKEPNFSRESISRPLYVIKILHFLRENVKKIEPDVILAFGEWTNPFVVLATYGLGIPLFLTDRMSPLAKLPVMSEWLRKLLYKKAAGIIAQTEFAKKELFTKTRSKNIKVIPNPVNTIHKLNCQERKRIVTVGRLSKEKGHRYLIEAFSNVTDISWELSLVGDGDERESLELMVKHLSLSDRVIFHGHLIDFSIQLSEAKIFVLPSLKEGFPNSLIEAMSVPLACISSNCIAGPGEIIKEGVNGLLVEPGNVGALVFALNKLIENQELMESLASEAFKIRETLAFDKIAQLYSDFIFKR